MTVGCVKPKCKAKKARRTRWKATRFLKPKNIYVIEVLSIKDHQHRLGKLSKLDLHESNEDMNWIFAESDVGC